MSDSHILLFALEITGSRLHIMEAITRLTYRIEFYPEPEKIGTIEVHTNFVIPVDMEPILTLSNFSCLLFAKELTEDNESPLKQELCNFLMDSGVDQQDALILISKLIQLACQVTSLDVYRPHHALSLSLTLCLLPLSEGSYLNDSEDDSQFEDAIQASLDEYDANKGIHLTSKLKLESLIMTTYKEKQDTSSVADKCTICLLEFVNGRQVATIPCGHVFDFECIVKWSEVGHVCPLCRFELPCEDNDILLSFYN